MYQFYVNDKLLHDTNIAELKIFDPKIELQQNEIGSFNFDIYPTNPYIDEIRKITSLIYVYQFNDLIFKGRAIETEKGTKNALKVYCEDDKAFLCDSIQEPFEYSGSIQGLLEMFIERHNAQVDASKQFKVGNVTVTDPNDYITRSDTQFLDTWNTIKEKLVDMLGGYITIRHELDGSYIDYLADYTSLNSQEIKFGENLLKVNRKEDCREIGTVLIPLGKKDEETGERLTIKEVNGGKNYIESADGIARYGRIVKVQTWDDVTIADNLLTKAKVALDDMLYLIESIEINAVDMARVGQNITNFKMNSKIHVVSNYHNINDYFVPMKMTFYPFKASQNKITLNSTKKTLTESSNLTSANYTTIINNVETLINNSALNVPTQIASSINNLRQELTTIIEQTSTSIITEVSESYYQIGDNDPIKQLQTILEQTKDYFEFTFNEFNSNLESAINSSNEEFSQLTQYIRFEDGSIFIGDNNSEFSAKFSKNGIELYQGTYKAMVLDTNGISINSIKMGNFILASRSNGNLSIKKAV